MEENTKQPKFPTAKNVTGQKFKLGVVVMTANAEQRLIELGDGPEHFLKAGECLARHAKCDWGDLDDEDKKANDEAVAHEGDPERQGRLHSAYTINGEKFWIITEHDRSVSTILLTDDY